jgi:tetratricopeptide (TPR) repeat protein
VDAARYQRLKDLVHAAHGIPPAVRRAFLEEACPGDPALLEEAWAFLGGGEVATRGLPVAAPAPVAEVAPGASVGGHRLGPEIGRGGMGIVFEIAGGGPARALKVIHPHFLALAPVRARFLREARLGLSVLHENLVRTLEVGDAVVGSQPLHYLVMERVHGRSLRAALEEMGSLPEPLVREIGRQAARGLAALHAAGIVHRDVKPENLLLADDRRLRIADLGVAKAEGQETSLTTAGDFVGSVHYAAPEQWDGRDVGPAADLYALGVVLYELLSGGLPFEGKGALEVARSRARGAAPPVLARAPRVSAFLSALVGALLEAEPERRLPSAADLAAILEEGEAGAWWAAHGGEASSGERRRRLPALPLVGREEERRALLDRFDRAASGAAQVVLLEGEAGIGKTRLVEELAASLATSTRVLRTSFASGDDAGSLRDALVQALAAPDLASDLARRLDLPTPRARALAAYLRREAPAAEGEGLPAQEGRAHAARLVRGLASDHPLVWIVEDVHAAPADSIATLLALARGVAPSRAMLLLASRPGLGADVRAALERIEGFTRLEVGRLAPAGVRALVDAVLGRSLLPERSLEALVQRSGGVPLFVLEILKDLERRGHVRRDPVGRARVDGALATVALPIALRDVVRARLAGLSSEERATIDAAAVVGVEFRPDLVARVRALPRLPVLETLARLERRDGLVHGGPKTHRFDHPLLHEVVYGDLPEALRREAHGLVADSLEAEPAGDEPPGARAARIAWHRLRSDAPDRAEGLVDVAREHLSGTYRHEEALDLATRALALRALASGARRVRTLLSAAHSARALGRPDDVGAFLEQAVAEAEGVDDEDLRVAAGNRRVAHLGDRGRYAEALVEIDRLLERARARASPGAWAEALCWRGQVLWCLGRHAEAKDAYEDVIRRARSTGLERLEARAAADLGVVFQEMGRLDEAAERYAFALEVIRRFHDRTNEAALIGNLGNVRHEQGRWAEALDCYERGLALDHEVGDLAGEAFAWVNLGATRLSLGDLEGGLEAYARCEAVCEQTGQRRVQSFAIHGRGQAALWAGDCEEARRRFESALALRRELGSRLGLADTLFELGCLDLVEGRTESARARLDEALVVAEDVGSPSTAVLAALHRALLPGEDPARARAVWDRHEAQVMADARLQALLLLGRLEQDPRHLEDARAILDAQVAAAPPRYRTTMVERVPYRRALSLAAPRPIL